MARQKFIDEHRELPPADKRDTLSVRLSDFIRDLDGSEKNLLEDVELTEFADIIARQMEQHLKEPATTWVIDCLAYSTKSRTESVKLQLWEIIKLRKPCLGSVVRSLRGKF